jgi:hypothetical protein
MQKARLLTFATLALMAVGFAASSASATPPFEGLFHTAHLPLATCATRPPAEPS